jgi:hypothetical protein
MGFFFTKTPNAKALICKKIGCHVMIDDNKDVLQWIAEENPSICVIQFIPHTSNLWRTITNFIQSLLFQEIRPEYDLDIKKLCYLIQKKKKKKNIVFFLTKKKNLCLIKKNKKKTNTQIEKKCHITEECMVAAQEDFEAVISVM